MNARLQSFTNSQTCSILISGLDEVTNFFLTSCFANFKLMKVMDCEGAPIDYIPKEVGNLFHLRYLSLRDTKVQILPKSIGKLHNLKTLDLKRSLVFELPLEISWLHKLQYLTAYIENNYIVYNIAHRCAVKIPSGIGCLQSVWANFALCSNYVGGGQAQYYPHSYKWSKEGPGPISSVRVNEYPRTAGK